MDVLCAWTPGGPARFCSEGTVIWGETCPLQRLTSVHPNHTQVCSPSAAAGGGSPAVLLSLSRVDLQGRDSSPFVREGAPQVHTHPLAVMDAQSRGHIPIPGKRNFPIHLPSKQACPNAGRSAQAPLPECLRNAIQNENAQLSQTTV